MVFAKVLDNQTQYTKQQVAPEVLQSTTLAALIIGVVLCVPVECKTYGGDDWIVSTCQQMGRFTFKLAHVIGCKLSKMHIKSQTMRPLELMSFNN